jgi:Fe-S cluster biosynthesis and repair protein YggX
MSEGADWKFYAGNESADYYYDRHSIKKISQDILEVWTKEVVISKKQKDLMIKSRQRDDLSARGFRDYAVELSLKEINCSTKEMRYLAIVDYNAVNKIIDSVDFTGKWFRILPDSIGKNLYNIVCKSMKE